MTFPEPARPTPTIPHLGTASGLSCQAGPHTQADPNPGPSSLWGCQSMTTHVLRGCPVQPGKAQVGRGHGEGGRGFRGFQPGNKTERTNPASKHMGMSHAEEAEQLGPRPAPLKEGLPHHRE